MPSARSTTALITGASSGIGAELARIHARGGGNLVLVARNRGRLENIKAELEAAYGIEVAIFCFDLCVANAAQELFDAASGIEIDILINNAGFGWYGKFHEEDPSRYEAMMQLNMCALTSLTRLYLPEMIERGHGRILNVASSAALLPGPLMAVYFATKSYVLSFSQAIAEELRGTGISVTVLCPGPVDTDFIARANLQDIRLFSRPQNASRVAKFGYEAMLKGRLVAFEDPRLRFLLEWIVPLLPRKMLLGISRRLLEKQG